MSNHGNLYKLNISERLKLAGGSTTSPETLAQLAEDMDWDVRWRVACNPNTQPETLAELAKDEDCYVRRSVALNPNTPAETLAELIKDEDVNVRRRVDYHPNAPQTSLATFSGLPVREGVAEDFNAVKEALAELTKDVQWIAGEITKENPGHAVSLDNKAAEAKAAAKSTYRTYEPIKQVESR